MITIVAIGNGGYNIARDIIDAKLFHSVNLLLFDSDSARIRKHSECANGSFMLLPGDYFIQRNKVKIVEIIKNINTDEVIIASSLNEFIGDNFTYPIAFAASLMGKSVSIISTMSFSHKDGRKVYDTNCDVNSRFLDSFDLLLVQNNFTASENTASENNETNRPIVDTLKNILRRFNLSELLTYHPSMDAFFPREFHDRLYCTLGGCSGLRRNIHKIKYWIEDILSSLEDYSEQQASGNMEAQEGIKTSIKNLRCQFLKFSIVEDIVKIKYGKDIPEYLQSDLNEIDAMLESFENL